MWNLVIHWLEKGVVETPKEMVVMMKKISVHIHYLF